MRFSIEHQCPQCGAPAVLEEAERLFHCSFCRVRSYLLGGKFFRYRFAPKTGGDRDIIYVPYWRFKGMMFSAGMDGIEHRFVDTSSIAVSTDYLPVSVGLRSQALTLKFVAPDTRGCFLRPTLPLKDMLDQVRRRFAENADSPFLYSSFVGDHVSLIYSPFYRDHKVHDAILERPVDCPVSEVDTLCSRYGERPDWSIRFVPVICPDCGWDLDGERESLTLNCRNCRTSWLSTEKGLLKLKFGLPPLEPPADLYMPFWRIRAMVSGVQLRSFRDLIRQANLPVVVQPGMEGRLFYFWVPAFKVRPEIFLRLSRKLTLAQPDQEMSTEFPRSRLYPVTLPVTEAVESLKIHLGGFARPAREMRMRLPEISIRPERFKLVYLPFSEEHHEWVQPDFHLTLHKNILSMARNL